MSPACLTKRPRAIAKCVPVHCADCSVTHDKCVGCDEERRSSNQRLFVELAAAYETLSVDETRSQYERGAGKLAAPPPGSDGSDGGGGGAGGHGDAFYTQGDAWARSQFDLARDPLMTFQAGASTRPLFSST